MPKHLADKVIRGKAITLRTGPVGLGQPGLDFSFSDAGLNCMFRAKCSLFFHADIAPNGIISKIEAVAVCNRVV